MKKLIVIFILLFSSSLFASKTVSIFVGYDQYNDKMYIEWTEVQHSLALLEHMVEKVPEKISKHAQKCINDRAWNKAKLLSVSKEGSDYTTYKFKFHWIFNSRVLYVDVDGGEMSCRKG